MDAPFKPGDHVFVKDDPDFDLFQGVTGIVQRCGVDCAMGEGMVVQSPEIGAFKGTYDMFGRIQ